MIKRYLFCDADGDTLDMAAYLKEDESGEYCFVEDINTLKKENSELRERVGVLEKTISEAVRRYRSNDEKAYLDICIMESCLKSSPVDVEKGEE